MSFSFIKRMFVTGIYLISNCMSQQIENNTLIYGFDDIHKINLYCQFASQEELRSLKSIHRKCFKQNKEMQHILADGTQTHPYAPPGSDVGFILKCGNIPFGKVKPNCSRYVYTNCSYTCEASDVVHTATCNLCGPWDNVTPQWSLTQPCGLSHTPVVSHTPQWSLTQPCGGSFTSSDSTPTIEEQGPAIDVPSNFTSAIGIANVALSSGDTPKDKTPVVIGVVTVSILILVLVVFFTVCFVKQRWTNKRRPSCAAQIECNGQSQINLETLQQEPAAEEIISQQQANDPLIEHIEAFPDLPESCVRSLTDYNYAHNNHKYKGIEDKNPQEELEKWIKLDFASLEESLIPHMSPATVSYSKAQNGFVATPDMCNGTVQLLKEQTHSYRKRLRAELEVIPGRSREQALIGYMEENAPALGYMPNEIKLLEKSYETLVDEKVSDEFLHKLAAYGVKLGTIVKYFHQHENMDAVIAITQVHRDCPFCGQFKIEHSRQQTADP